MDIPKYITYNRNLNNLKITTKKGDKKMGQIYFFKAVGYLGDAKNKFAPFFCLFLPLFLLNTKLRKSAP
jgi:hypothetical protein